MARGFVRSVEGSTVTLVDNREDVGRKPKDGEVIQTRSVHVSKLAPLTVDGRKGCRVADLQNGDEVILSEVNGQVTGGTAKREPLEAGARVPAPAGTNVFTEDSVHGIASSRAGRPENDTFNLSIPGPTDGTGVEDEVSVDDVANNEPVDPATGEPTGGGLSQEDSDALLHRGEPTNKE
jgi:hypothetical protein